MIVHTHNPSQGCLLYFYITQQDSPTFTNSRRSEKLMQQSSLPSHIQSLKWIPIFLFDTFMTINGQLVAISISWAPHTIQVFLLWRTWGKKTFLSSFIQRPWGYYVSSLRMLASIPHLCSPCLARFIHCMAFLFSSFLCCVSQKQVSSTLEERRWRLPSGYRLL